MTTRLETGRSLSLVSWRRFFVVAALYDGILGAVFFFFYNPLYRAFGIALPNHPSYVQLTAGFVFVQGVSYWLVSRNPLKNMDMVKVGIFYKAIYCGVILYYLAIGQLYGAVIFAWLAVFDVVFLALFVLFIRQAKSQGLAH
jgi:hypothetical protein